MSNATWSTQQLTEYLAIISSAPDPGAATREAIERSAESLEAELGAVIRDGEVVASVGFGSGALPQAQLVALARQGADRGELAGVGACRLAAAPLEGPEPGWLLLARVGDEAFDPGDVSLLRGMARVLALTLRTLRLLDEERALREESQRQADDNARLLASLEERQALMEQLAKLQATIAHRTPLQEVLDTIVHGAGDLLGEEIAALRLVDASDATHTATVASRGLYEGAPLVRRLPLSVGAGGRAITEDRLLVFDDYDAANPTPNMAMRDVRTAIAVPLHEHGTVVGGLTVGSRDPARRFDQRDQELLLAYAKQASLALAAARAVDTMRHAFSDSLPACRTARCSSTACSRRSRAPSAAAVA